MTLNVRILGLIILVGLFTVSSFLSIKWLFILKIKFREKTLYKRSFNNYLSKAKM